MAQHTLRFEGSGGEPVTGVLHEAEAADAPLVLICPGFKGFKDWGFFPALAEHLARQGLSALRLDFSHNGVRERDFDRLDLFEQDTWTRHQEDLTAVIEGRDDPVIGIVGHSRGAADAILCAAGDARVRAVVALAPVSSAWPPFPDVEQTLQEHGYYPVPNARTGQLMRVGRAFFEDARRHDVLDAAWKMSDRPLCVIHGSADETVGSEAGRRLAEKHGDAEFHLVEGAGHTFGAVHPYQGETPELTEAFRLATAFLRRELL